MVDVVDHAGADPVDAHQRDAAEDTLCAEQCGQPLFVPQAVLKGEDRCLRPEQRADERLVGLVIRRLQRNDHQVRARHALRTVVHANAIRGQLEITRAAQLCHRSHGPESTWCRDHDPVAALTRPAHQCGAPHDPPPNVAPLRRWATCGAPLRAQWRFPRAPARKIDQKGV